MYYAVGIYNGDIPARSDAERIWFRARTGKGTGFWSNDKDDAKGYLSRRSAMAECAALTNEYSTMVLNESEMNDVRAGFANLLSYTPSNRSDVHSDNEDVVSRYAGILNYIYDSRTAGDDTFESVLTAMLKEIK